MAGYTLRFCPEAVELGKQVDFRTMLDLMCSHWAKPRGKQILSIQCYAHSDDYRLEVRLFRETDPRNKDNLEEGYKIASSWLAWYHSDAREDDYPHNPAHGYALVKKTLMEVVPYIFRNYYKDIVQGRYHRSEEQECYYRKQLYDVREFDGAEENRFVDSQKCLRSGASTATANSEA